MASARKYDVVVWGATGFTGGLVAKYFSQHYTSSDEKKDGENVSWAIAGRSKSKLQAVKDELVQSNPACERIPILIGDASDQASVDDVVRQTKVIVSTAGPFIKYGEAVVSACARLGTCYADITGESLWVRRMMDRYGAVAEKSGALIVSMCGFDSIPSDVGAFFVAQHIKTNFKQDTKRIHSYHYMKGEASGGTIATMMEMMSLPVSELKKGSNPYLLNDKDNTPERGDAEMSHNADVKFMSYSQENQCWTVPFVMAAPNTRVARRSAANLKYGKKCTYNETMKMPGFFSATAVMCGLILFVLLMLTRCGRVILKCFLPAPGQGPSDKVIANGWFKAEVVGTAEDGSVVKALVAGDKDPGYGATSGMLAEAGLCMVLHLNECAKAGFRTPAEAFGQTLIRRLPKAGVTFTVLEQKRA